MEGDEGLTSRTYSDTFKQLCPYYMSIGMSYDDFWNGDVSMVEAYRTADELRLKQRNYELWLQGMYMYEALCDASPLFRFSMKGGTVKPEPYVKEPYPITPAEAREHEERAAKAEEERLKAEFARFAEQIAKRKKMSPETQN